MRSYNPIAKTQNPLFAGMLCQFNFAVMVVHAHHFSAFLTNILIFLVVFYVVHNFPFE